jgi:hypothetical protein
VKRHWLRREDRLARELRANRPEPSDEFVRVLAQRLDGGRKRLYAASRFSFAAALTVLVLGSLASFGGVGYAASGANQAFTAVKQIVKLSSPHVVRKTAAQDQYEPKKVTICHKGHTIKISRSALPAHLRHGDTIGPCPAGSGTLGAGTLASVGSGQNLPATGLSLGATALLSLALLLGGVALRRRAREDSYLLPVREGGAAPPPRLRFLGLEVPAARRPWRSRRVGDRLPGQDRSTPRPKRLRSAGSSAPSAFEREARPWAWAKARHSSRTIRRFEARTEILGPTGSSSVLPAV